MATSRTAPGNSVQLYPADKPVKSSLRFAGTKVQETLRSPNFVVLHLKTKCNIAEVLSKRELKWSASHAGYQVMDWLSLFDKLPFLKLSDWELTMEPLTELHFQN